MKKILDKIIVLMMVVLTSTTLLCANVVKAETEVSNNLNDFVSSAEIKDANGNTIGGGDKTPNLYVGQTYKFKVDFTEVAENETNGGRQMTMGDDSATLIYLLPEQLVATVNNSGTVNIVLKEGNDTYEITGNYLIGDRNQMTVTINASENPNYQKLKDASDVEFYVEFEAKISGDELNNEINFGGNVKQNVNIKNEASLTLNKYVSKYDKANGKFYYTITVTSTGYSKNVVVTDTFGSDVILTYDASSFSASSNKTDNTLSNASLDNENALSNGFKYTIPAISDGEVITITYCADIDYSKLGDNVNFTVDQTKNTVTAKGDNTNEPSQDYSYTQSAYTVITKKGEASTNDGDVQETIWAITVNEDCKVSMGGKTVSDTLQNTITKYIGEGITITTYDSQNNKVGDSQNISWTSLTKYSETTGWTYTLPGDTEAYKYVITYKTSTDTSNISTSTTISNKAKVEGKGETTGSITINPNANANFSVSKTHDGSTLSSTNVDYTVTVNLPKKGLSSLTMVDTLPSNNWSGGKYLYDSYNEEKGVTVKLGSEIVDSNKYTVERISGSSSEGKAEQIKITFNDCLMFTSGDEDKMLTITYSTIPNKDWTLGEDHTNTVNVTIDGTTKSTTDTFKLTNIVFEKSKANQNSSTYWISETNQSLPYFKFKIRFNGVTSEPVVFTETFNKEIFKIIQTTGNSWDEGLALLAGDYDYNINTDITNNSTISFTDNSNGTVTISILPAKKSDGNYYNYYELYYALAVKDLDAFTALKQLALNNDGTYSVTNTATWGNNTSTADATYEYNPLVKTYSKGNNDYTASYTLTINANKDTLNNGNSYTVNDSLVVTSGLGVVSYDPSSFVIKVNDAVTTDLSPIFSENNKSMSITVPDNSKIEITYNVYLSGNDGFKFKNELSAKDKYHTESKEVEFKNNAGGTASIFEFTVTKIDSVTNEVVAGATYKLQIKNVNGKFEDVINKNNNEVATFTTGDDGSFKIGSKDSQTKGWTVNTGSVYRLVETSAPNGYSINNEPKTFEVLDLKKQYDEIPDDAVTNGSIIYVSDTPNSAVTLTATKTFDGKEPTDKYTFTLEQASSDAIQVKNNKQEVKNDGSSIKFGTLNFAQEGTYNFEIKETAGTDTSVTYDSSVYKVKVTVSKDSEGNLSVSKAITKDNVSVDAISFENKTASTKPEKGKLILTKTLVGAISKDDVNEKLSFTIKDPNNNETIYAVGKDNFDYDDNTKTYTLTLNDIEIGTYTITENNYTVEGKTVTTTYSVNSGEAKTGTELSVEVKSGDSASTVAYTNTYENNTYDVNISKVDLTSSEELSGAKLTLKKGEEVIKTWTSEGKSTSFKLEAGTYTLIEDQAPTGYNKAESITFVIDKEGNITCTTEGALNGSTITMKDTKEGEIEISKVDATGGQEIEGAKLTITKKGDSEFKEISWTSGDDGKNEDGTIKTHIVKLAPGTYVLTETTAPDGYEVAESITFTVTSEGKIKRGSEEYDKVTMKDNKKTTPNTPNTPNTPETPKEEEKPKESTSKNPKYVVVNTSAK